MSDVVVKSKTNIYNKRRNLIVAKTKKKAKSSPYNQKNCQKTFDRLSKFEQKQIIKNLKIEYSLILFDYFSDERSINSKIENFSKEAFKVNLPISKVVEIHMELIDSLENQLIVEGLHSEFISIFRLTLINVIAHLGEMYRKAICDKCLDDGLSIANTIGHIVRS